MDDLISRQVAISEIVSMTTMGVEELVIAGDKEKYDWIKGLSDSLVKIINLPSAEPKNLQPTCNQLATDCISRQEAIDELEEQLDYLQMLNKDENPTAQSKWYGVNWARNTIAELPSAEPEIIRCKDCLKYDAHGHRCKHWNHAVVVMDWCSRAERRTDDLQ